MWIFLVESIFRHIAVNHSYVAIFV